MTAIQFAGQKMFAPLHMLKQDRKARIDFSVFAFCEKNCQSTIGFMPGMMNAIQLELGGWGRG
jgi:hypothetical protein